MTLGDLIEVLRAHDKNTVVPMGFNSPHSYRGDYCELAFEPKKNITVGEMLECAERALNSTFTGYKGGEFTMKEYTSVYIANYGECGEEIGRVLLGYMLGGDFGGDV